jgi:1-acyl-sn-glycerol-3-phosphate acyltransferase
VSTHFAWWLWVRSLVFYAGYVVATIWFGFSGLLLVWTPYPVRARYLLCWNRVVLRWFTSSCGVSIKLVEAERTGNGPWVIVSNHQSAWETIFLQAHFHPVATILKRELLAIPGFGWGLWMMRPIAIDRGSPRESIRQLLRQGKQRLADGLSVLVYPEGTRQPAGTRHAFARGGAGLAHDNGVAVVPVAHNAGRCWPAGRFIKIPGTITVVIGRPIDTQGLSSMEINRAAESWIHQQMDAIGA